MPEYLKSWLALRLDKRAVTAVEYGLIAALIAVAIIASVSTLGTKLATQFSTIAVKLSAT